MIEITTEYIEIARLRPAVERVCLNAVMLHEKVGGRGEDARYFARLAKTCNNVNRLYSTHYYVDDKTIINIIPEDEIAIHSNAEDNNSTIAITMCVYCDCDYDALIENTEELLLDILTRNGVKLVSDFLILSPDVGQSCAKFAEENRYTTILKHLQQQLLSQSSCDCDDTASTADETICADEVQTVEVEPVTQQSDSDCGCTETIAEIPSSDCTDDADDTPTLISGCLFPRSGIGEAQLPPIRSGESNYPPADTEDESLDYLALERYRNLV